jgi:hypothetical protein
MLENAKMKWAEDHHETAQDAPTWSDLLGTNHYIEFRVQCPSGGVITIGRVGEPPKCTVAGHSL